MTRSTLTLYSLVSGFLLLSLSVQSFAVAGNVLGEGIDCTEIFVKYKEDPNLTRDERIQKMDEAFLESLHKFEICESIKRQKKNSGGNAGADGDGQSSTESHSGGQSTASSTMSGTDPVDLPSSGKSRSSGATEPANTEKTAQNEDSDGVRMVSSNGKTPEDIPPAGNDDILAAQIRYAAENETDPEKKKQLWNEYRKYKGLPPKT